MTGRRGSGPSPSLGQPRGSNLTAHTRIEGHVRHLDWVVDQNGSVLTIALRGEVDLASVTDFEPSLDRYMSNGHAYLVLDLAGVKFIDSSGLRLLLRLKQRFEEGAVGSLLLGRLSQPVHQLLELTDLTTRFAYVDGETPTALYCPDCGRQLPTSADRCSSCGGVF